MQYLFISQPMAGLSKKEILEIRTKAISYIKTLYPDDKIEPITSYFEYENPTAKDCVNLLGQAISKMCKSDIIYFAPGWQNSRGCQIENEIARRYLEPIGVHLIEDGMENVNIEMTTEQYSILQERADKNGISIHKYMQLILEMLLYVR